VMYLEGSDQHRGWFHSSLLESCGTKGHAPFDIVLTHGFVLDEQGKKMSKSTGNVTAPQDIIKDSGADILRLWIASSDYSDDLRVGKEILKNTAETYKKLRNTIRWMLGTLAHFDGVDVAYQDLPELEQYMLHKLAALTAQINESYANFDYKRVVSLLTHFMNIELSSFYFDIRKDALYCEARSSNLRRASLTVVNALFETLTIALAPILSFTSEEAWLSRFGEGSSVHLQALKQAPATWVNDAVFASFEQLREVRRVVTGALELERAEKRIGSSLEANPKVYLPATLKPLFEGVNFADICITSSLTLVFEASPNNAFTLPDVKDIGVVVEKASGIKCARSWRYFDASTANSKYPDITPRDAIAMMELA
jgi:isoleucyl-tRNA synthetase